jgi:hypothetical protein
LFGCLVHFGMSSRTSWSCSSLASIASLR